MPAATRGACMTQQYVRAFVFVTYPWCMQQAIAACGLSQDCSPPPHLSAVVLKYFSAVAKRRSSFCGATIISGAHCACSAFFMHSMQLFLGPVGLHEMPCNILGF